MDEFTCHRCGRPATTRDSAGVDWCMGCVANEASQRRPYALTAYEALEVLGHHDLAREVKWRQGVLDAAAAQEPLPFEYERMMQ